VQLTCAWSTFIHYRPHINSTPLPHQSSKCHHRKTQYHRLQGAEGVHAGHTTPTLYVHVPVYMHAEAAGRCGCISDGRHSTYRLINNRPDDSTIVRDFALNTSLLGLYDSPEARGTLTGSWHVSLRCSTHAPTNTVGQSFSGELHIASNAPQNPTHAALCPSRYPRDMLHTGNMCISKGRGLERGGRGKDVCASCILLGA
jgi:hypothetical protein